MIIFDSVTYTYPEAAQPALREVTLRLAQGEFVLVVGPSGAGKSTLLRCVNGLAPHFSGGTLQGRVTVNGLEPVRATPQWMSRQVGFVFQDPEAQFVLDRVEDEIAFALENAAMPPPEMRARVEELLDLLDLARLRNRRLETLSGGEQQRLAMATALAFRPAILVLDEPTSQLDPQSAEEVLQALLRLKREVGLTILLAEHRLERVLPAVDRIVYLPVPAGGALCGSPGEILPQLEEVPPLISLSRKLGWQPLPLTLEAGQRFSRAWLAEVAGGGAEPPARTGRLSGRPGGEPYLQAEAIEAGYNGRPVLAGVNLEVWPGEIVVLLGRNGAGKTTLLKSLVGLVRPWRGRIRVAGQEITRLEVAQICRKVGYLPQDPNALLFADTVLDEVRLTLRNHRLRAADLPLPPERLLERLGLGDKLAAYPRDLSAGERQRVALAAVMVTHPGALLLDEPTRGLDYAAKQKLVELLRSWRAEGMAILLATHDVELAAAVADRAVLLSQGQISADGSPVEVLGASSPFAPQVARLFPGTGWLTVEDVPS